MEKAPSLEMDVARFDCELFWCFDRLYIACTIEEVATGSVHLGDSCSIQRWTWVVIRQHMINNILSGTYQNTKRALEMTFQGLFVHVHAYKYCMIAPICCSLSKLPHSSTRSLCMHAPGRLCTVLPRNAVLLSSSLILSPQSQWLDVPSPPSTSNAGFAHPTLTGRQRVTVIAARSQ